MNEVIAAADRLAALLEEQKAVIEYKAEIGYDKGDYWTAPPCSWVERDEVAVEVYTEDGDDAEAAEWLKKMLN